MFVHKLAAIELPLALLGLLAAGTAPLAAQPPRTLQQVASAVAFEQVDIYPAVPGVLTQLKVDIGDRVKRDQVIAVMDARLLQLKVDRAKAGLEQAQAQAAQMEAAVDTAKALALTADSVVQEHKAKLDAAEAAVRYRQLVVDRMRDLFRTRALDERLLTEATEQLGVAKGHSATAAAALERAKAGVVVKQSSLKEAQAARAGALARVKEATLALDNARQMVDLTRIVAPFDGVITQRNYAVGQLLRPGEPSARRPIYTVQRTDILRVVVQIPGRDALAVKVGDAASLTFDALPGVKLKAKVSRIGYVLDPSNRTMRAEIDVPNTDGRLRPGMAGTATLELR